MVELSLSQEQLILLERHIVNRARNSHGYADVPTTLVEHFSTNDVTHKVYHGCLMVDTSTPYALHTRGYKR